MSDVLSELLPVILGATLAPIYPIIVLLLLQSQDGLRKSMAFVSGAVAVRSVQGVLFGLVFGAAATAYGEDGSKLIASTLLVVVGILLLISALLKWRKQPDPDDPSPKWMAAIGGLSTLKALGAGALFVAIAVKQWVFTLTAIDIIAGAALGTAAAVTTYLIFVLATQGLALLPILAYAVAPRLAARPLRASLAWLERNNRVIMIGASLVFGVFFLSKGISGLIG